MGRQGQHLEGLWEVWLSPVLVFTDTLCNSAEIREDDAEGMFFRFVILKQACFDGILNLSRPGARGHFANHTDLAILSVFAQDLLLFERQVPYPSAPGENFHPLSHSTHSQS